MIHPHALLRNPPPSRLKQLQAMLRYSLSQTAMTLASRDLQWELRTIAK